MKAKCFTDRGSGWRGESLRHRDARLKGKASPSRFSGIAKRPINKNSDKIFYYTTNDAPYDATQLGIGTAIESEHTKDSQIAKAIAKAHLEQDKDYYKKLQMMENKPEPPVGKEAFGLPIQLRLTVPSTYEKDKKLSSAKFRARIAEVEKELSTLFGGDTTIKGDGGYISNSGDTKGQLIKERVAIVETSMTPQQYKDNKEKIEAYLATKKREWGQETLMVGFEDENYIY